MTAGVARAGGRLLAGTGAHALLAPAAVLLIIAFVVPLAAVVAKVAGVYGLDGVVTAPLGNGGFRDSLLTTVLLAALTTLVTLALGLAYALAMALAGPVGAALLSGVLIVSFWISLLVRTYGWLLALQPNGALDWAAREAGLGKGGLGLFQTLPGLVLPMVHILLPYMVLPIYAAIQGIDPSHLRAARSLGAGSTLVLRSVVVPAARPGALAGVVLVFVVSLGFYVTPAFLGDPGDRVVAIVVGEVFGRQRDLALAAAMGVLLLVVITVIYMVADRLLRVSEQLERF